MTRPKDAMPFTYRATHRVAPTDVMGAAAPPALEM